MNKHTVRAIQARVDCLKIGVELGDIDLNRTIRMGIGDRAYDFRFNNPYFEPFVLVYCRYSGNHYIAGVIRDWKFIPDVEPERRTK